MYLLLHGLVRYSVQKFLKDLCKNLVVKKKTKKYFNCKVKGANTRNKYVPSILVFSSN